MTPFASALAEDLTKTEIAHYKAVNIDPSHVGKNVKRGAQYQVRELGGDAVVKILLKDIVDWGAKWRVNVYALTFGRMLAQTLATASCEIHLCKKYFGDYLLETTIVAEDDDQGPRFCVRQELADIELVTPEILQERGKVRRDMQQIFEKNSQLIAAHGLWLDVAGYHGEKTPNFVFFGIPYFENVAVRRGTEEVVLFDTGLFPLPRKVCPLLKPYYWMLYQFQCANAQKCDLDFAPGVNI